MQQKFKPGGNIMALISRISRLFKADFHAVLDHVEEPHMLLKQAVREMEEELNAGEMRHREALVEREDLNARQEEMLQALSDIDEELDICFEDEKSELARELIKRKLQAQRVNKRVAARLEAAQKALLEDKKILAEHQAALESARQKAELFQERLPHKACDSAFLDDMAWNPRALAVSDNDVEVAFLREKKRRAQS
jgi:phage shock protein A